MARALKDMGAAKLPHLFEIGFTRTGSRVRMHTGLAHVRSVVDKHHGDIKVASSGGGTTFEIVLPVRPPE